MLDKGVVLSLEGKVAVVTGGSRGIGAAIVRMFVRDGAKVLFNYQRAETEANRLAQDCGGEKHCVAVRAELSSPESAAQLVKAAVEHFGRVDVLVGNHGVWPPQDVPVDQMTDQQWRTTLAVNLDSVFGLVKSGVAQMKKQGSGGHVVLISSTAGQRGE